MLAALLRYRLARLWRYFAHQTGPRLITAGIFLAIFLVLALGIYQFFRAGFIFIESDAYAHQALLLYVYELFLLIVSGLVFASAFISGLLGFFQSRSNWLMASSKFRAVPFWTALDVLSSAIWPFFLMVVPALLAIRNVSGLGWGGMAISAIAIFLLVALMVASAIILLFALGYLLLALQRATHRPFLRLGWLIFLGLAVCALGVWGIYARLGTSDIIRLFPAAFGGAVASPANIVEQFQVFPTHFAAYTLFAYGQGDTTAGFVAFGTLLLFVSIAMVALVFLMISYLPLWQVLQEGGYRADRGSAKPSGPPIRFPRYLTGPVGALFEKEALVLRRVPRNALWLGFMILLWSVQTLLNFFIRQNMVRHAVTPDAAAHLLQALHVLVTVYFMSALSLRFVFPAFSAERRTAWLLASAPIDLARVYAAKFAFYAGLFALLGGFMVGLNTLILDLSFAELGPFAVITALAILFVTALALAMGAWFPNFETDDPEQLATSMPGLGFTGVSLAYGAGGAYALADLLARGSYLFFGGFILFSLVGLFIFLHFPPRALARLEFGVGGE